MGQFQDSKQQQGLAHYLEHVLFIGSKNFSESGALQKNNSGTYNAVTEAQSTSYFFQIANKQYSSALAMSADSIKFPLLNNEYSKKRINCHRCRMEARQTIRFFHH